MCAQFHVDWDVQKKCAWIRACAHIDTSDVGGHFGLSVRHVSVWNPRKSLYTRPQECSGAINLNTEKHSATGTKPEPTLSVPLSSILHSQPQRPSLYSTRLLEETLLNCSFLCVRACPCQNRRPCICPVLSLTPSLCRLITPPLCCCYNNVALNSFHVQMILSGQSQQ